MRQRARTAGWRLSRPGLTASGSQARPPHLAYTARANTCLAPSGAPRGLSAPRVCAPPPACPGTAGEARTKALLGRVHDRGGCRGGAASQHETCRRPGVCGIPLGGGGRGSLQTGGLVRQCTSTGQKASAHFFCLDCLLSLEKQCRLEPNEHLAPTRTARVRKPDVTGAGEGACGRRGPSAGPERAEQSHEVTWQSQEKRTKRAPMCSCVRLAEPSGWRTRMRAAGTTWIRAGT